MTSSQPRRSDELPGDLKEKKQLKPGQNFCFGCHPGLSCFTDCCADINILLTPTDILRLARRLGITTSDFLDQYTLTPITKELHLPVVALKMGDDEKKHCQLLGENGCSVYEDRPWSCRMYPVGMAIPPARAGEEPEAVHVLFEDDFCKGHGESTEWTIESWRDDQGLIDREELEKGFQEIVSHPWFIGGRTLDPKRMEMFHMSCFDLDAFRRFIFDTSFLTRFDVEQDVVDEIRSSDEALLRFAFRWLRFALFAEPTMKVRGEQAEAGDTE